MAEPMRIQRALARAGVLSRRKAEELVANGRVTVNGTLAKIGQSVDPERDVILVDGARIGAPAPFEWYLLHKPAGVITSRGDPEGRRTVFDLVPKRPGLTYVGRLDYMTEGALLFTTDGTAAHRLTHPSRRVERTYVASVTGDGEAAIEQAKTTDADKLVPVIEKMEHIGTAGTDTWDKRHDLIWAVGKTTGIAVQWQDGKKVPFWPSQIKGMQPYKMPAR